MRCGLLVRHWILTTKSNCESGMELVPVLRIVRL